MGNVANTVQQMVGGSFDIAVSTFDTAIRAIGNGADAVLIGGVVVKYPYSIMAAKEIGKVQDLKGKQIILPFQKDLLTIVWNRWVREQGMQPADIDQVYDGATPNRFAALTGNRVQAALLGQPFDFRAADQGYKTLLDIGAYAKDYGFLTLMARPKWLADNAETARAYLRALSAAVDWIYDARQPRGGDRHPGQGHQARPAVGDAHLRLFRQDAAAVQPQAGGAAEHRRQHGEDPGRARRREAGRAGGQAAGGGGVSAEVSERPVPAIP